MEVNQQQFRIWHDRYRPRLLNSMTTVVRDWDIAEDITSTALAIAWQRLNQFRGEASLYTWVYRIAHNPPHNPLGDSLEECAREAPTLTCVFTIVKRDLREDAQRTGAFIGKTP